ncbi:MAG: hypothetical protein GY786_24505 [Proteobacteria bacterium]|nr:hypothetical protein [Pseudomonadota bacterium]
MILRTGLKVICVILLLTMVLLLSIWINLSGDKLSRWVEYQANRLTGKQYQFKVVDAKPRIWGLSIGELSVSGFQGHEQLLNLQNIELKVDPYTLIRNKGGIQVNTGVYLGKFKGVITYYPESKFKYEFHEIQPNRNIYLRKQGFINSNPTISGTGSTVLSKSLNPELSVLQLNILQLGVSGKGESYSLPLTLPDLKFSRITAGLRYNNKLFDLDIQSVGDLNMKVKGNLVADFQRWKRSKIDIKVFADLHKDYEKKLGFVKTILKSYSSNSGKISVHLQGSMGAPKIKKIQ